MAVVFVIRKERQEVDSGKNFRKINVLLDLASVREVRQAKVGIASFAFHCTSRNSSESNANASSVCKLRNL